MSKGPEKMNGSDEPVVDFEHSDEGAMDLDEIIRKARGETWEEQNSRMGKFALTAEEILDSLGEQGGKWDLSKEERKKQRRLEREAKHGGDPERNRGARGAAKLERKSRRGKPEAVKKSNKDGSRKILAIGLAGVIGISALGGTPRLVNWINSRAQEKPAVGTVADKPDVGYATGEQAEALGINVDYYMINSKGEREELSDNLYREADLSAGVDAVFHADVDRDGAYDDATKKEGVNAFGPTLSEAELRGDTDTMKREFLGNSAERMAKQPMFLAEEIATNPGYIDFGDYQFRNTPEGVNKLATYLSGLSAEEYQEFLDAAVATKADEYKDDEIGNATVKAGTHYITKHAEDITDGKDTRVETVVQYGCSHDEDFEVVFSLDDEGNRECDFGVMKLNILKSHGLCNPDMTVEQAENEGIMDKYTVLGQRVRCGGQWVIVVNAEQSTPAKVTTPVKTPDKPITPPQKTEDQEDDTKKEDPVDETQKREDPIPVKPPEQEEEKKNPQKPPESPPEKTETTETVPKTDVQVQNEGAKVIDHVTQDPSKEDVVKVEESAENGGEHKARGGETKSEPGAKEQAQQEFGGGEKPVEAPEFAQKIEQTPAQETGAAAGVSTETGAAESRGENTIFSDSELADIFSLMQGS